MFDKIADKLVDSKTISAEDKELYEYGLRQAASTLANVATTLIIGFIFGMILESILFMMSYIPLRSYAGGYHARTPVRCHIYSAGLIICVLLIVRYMSLNLMVIGALVLTASVIVFIFAPVADTNKPLDEVELKLFKKRTRIILFIEIGLIALFLILRLTLLADCLTVSLSIASLMVLAGSIKSKIIKIVENI